MTDIYKNLNFRNNPFSKRSSEQEEDFIEEIFYSPNYYSTLINDLESGDSRFIIGHRGHGKTSIINKLYNDLEKKEDVCVIKIDRFETIPSKDNEIHFLFLLTKKIIEKYVLFLFKNKKLIESLSDYQKEELSYFISVFYRTVSKQEFKKALENVHKIEAKNIFRRSFNFVFRDVFNRAINIASSVTSDWIRSSLGLPNEYSELNNKEYIPKLELLKNEQKEIGVEEFTLETIKDLLYKSCELASSIKLKKIVVLFDKIDEKPDLDNDVAKVSLFVKDILSDTELLMKNTIAIGFSLWSELKNELSGTVRFDKFGIVDVRWIEENMEPLINKRLEYYSDDKTNTVTFEKLIKDKFDRKKIIKLSNRSPRDLISILFEILKEQANSNPNSKVIEDEIISKALKSFCRHYDYESLIPSRAARKKDVKSMINKLLILKLERFITKDLTNGLKQNPRKSVIHTKLMLEYKLIREEDIPDKSGQKVYEVIDPKISYMISKMVNSIE
ncbi:MAG: P-loop ATPase, Sll1717 family [Phocaeicola sp.]